MATDIELVIKIPEEVYKASQIIDVTYDDVIQIPLECIANGIPLPKGHGDLVDFDKLCREYWDGNYMEIHRNDLQSIKPIIEADMERSGEE